MNDRNIYYLINSFIPNEFANSRQVIEMCQSFKNIGNKSSLLFPTKNILNKNNKLKIFNYYNISKKNKFFLKPVYLGSLYKVVPEKLKNLFSILLTIINMYIYSKIQKPQYVYIRDWEFIPLLVLLRSLIGYKIIFEVHNIPTYKYEKLILKKFINKLDLIVFLNKQQKDKFSQMKLFAKNILIAGDAVNLSRFNRHIDRDALKESLSLPKNKKLIGYVGRLESMGVDKGIIFLINSIIKFFKTSNIKNVQFYILGGPNRVADKLREKVRKVGLSKKIILTGQVDYKKIPSYLISFDLLLLPQPTDKHFSKYASPLKLFEYMASQTPIIATRVPSILNTLNESEATIIKSGDITQFSKAMVSALKNKKKMITKASNAYNKVKKISWDNRAKLIISHIEKK